MIVVDPGRANIEQEGLWEHLCFGDTPPLAEVVNAQSAPSHWAGGIIPPSGSTLKSGVPDLPEALVSGREETWLRYIFSSWCCNPRLFSGEETAEYVRAYSQPGALRGAFNDYRAGPEDVVQDEKDEEVLIECPSLVLWGEDFAIGGKIWDFRSIWKELARDPSFL